MMADYSPKVIEALVELAESTAELAAAAVAALEASTTTVLTTEVDTVLGEIESFDEPVRHVALRMAIDSTGSSSGVSTEFIVSRARAFERFLDGSAQDD